MRSIVSLMALLLISLRRGPSVHALLPHLHVPRCCSRVSWCDMSSTSGGSGRGGGRGGGGRGGGGRGGGRSSSGRGSGRGGGGGGRFLRQRRDPETAPPPRPVFPPVRDPAAIATGPSSSSPSSSSSSSSSGSAGPKVILEKGKARLFQDGNPLIYGGAVKVREVLRLYCRSHHASPLAVFTRRWWGSLSPGRRWRWRTTWATPWAGACTTPSHRCRLPFADPFYEAPFQPTHRPRALSSKPTLRPTHASASLLCFSLSHNACPTPSLSLSDPFAQHTHS